MNRRTFNRVGGFSLVELLVVISIVALLVSMLLPALSQAKTVERTLICTNVERGMVQASNAYSADYKQITIHGDNSPWYARTGETWFEGTHYYYDQYTRMGAVDGQYPLICHVGMLMLGKYLPEKKEAIGCPQSDFRVSNTPTRDTTNLDEPKTVAGGYDGLNLAANGLPNYQNFPGSPYRTTYSIRGPLMSMENLHKGAGWADWTQVANSYQSSPRLRPDQLAFFADHEEINQNVVTQAVGVTTGGIQLWSYVHAQGFNVGYLDGHAEMWHDELRQKIFTVGAYGGDPSNYGTSYSMPAMDRN